MPGHGIVGQLSAGTTHGLLAWSKLGDEQHQLASISAST
jgi:hypothetical protein